MNIPDNTAAIVIETSPAPTAGAMVSSLAPIVNATKKPMPRAAANITKSVKKIPRINCVWQSELLGNLMHLLLVY